MIPILFGAAEKEYDNNGLGGLTDTISCIVTEERNGAFELEMTYPITGALYKEIKTSAQIMAIPGDGRSRQAFRIYKISKPLNGIISINAEHISYQLSYIPVAPFQAENATQAIEGLKNHAAEECPFTFWTDKSTTAKFKVEEPVSIRSRLGGVQGSILDVYGGEYDFDMYTVRLYNQRGADRGVVLRYGKNITDLNQEENISNTITGIYPYWKDSEGNLVQLPEKTISAESAKNYPYPRTIPYDFSEDFENAPTEEQLRKTAEDYVKKSGIGVPSVSISVSFVALWQTEEYKEIAPLERVQLCDTVTVQFSELGVSATAKVNKTTWDVLNERYESIELGDAKSNLSTTIVAQEQEIAQKPSESFMQNAVNNATNWITNGRGYMVGIRDADGNLMEICSLDKKGIEEAVSVWRWNNGGFGHSKTGYNGPYTTAITQDGKIVADFITAGTFFASLIKRGNLADQEGNFFLDMESGELRMKNGEFTGKVTSSEGNVAGFQMGKDGFQANISGKAHYTEADLMRAQQIALKIVDADAKTIAYYDLNKDGRVTSADLLLMQRIINGQDPAPDIQGKVRINPASVDAAVTVEGTSNNAKGFGVRIGIGQMNGSTAEYEFLNVKSLTVGNAIDGSGQSNVEITGQDVRIRGKSVYSLFK